MNLFSIFKENKLEDLCSDEEEFDRMSQLIVELSKLIATVQSHDKINHKKYEYLETLKEDIEALNVIITNAFPMLALFDFKDVRFNGYRSIFHIIKQCMSQISCCLKKLSSNIAFNRTKHEKQCKDYVNFLTQLTTIAKNIFQMMVVQKDNKSLFLHKHDNEEVHSSMLECYDSLNTDVFYGQCLGFYLCEPCQILAKFFCSIQLGMGQAMSLPKSNIEIFVSTVVNSAQSLWMERKRGEQMANLFGQATITFCKQFWNLVDHPIVINWFHLVLPYLKIINEITLEPISLLLPLVNDPDANIKISPPVAHSGFAKVFIRLLSKSRRQGMEWISKDANGDEYLEPSPCLLIHCHGGGFVAQSSQSHDGYLRQWAIDLNYPIVSIDYSLAPEYPYPRAHEECLYSYAWVLKNLSQLGCSPDCRIIICGDSAGGNLALGCVMKVLQLNIRAPDAILLAYPATLINFVPSPARIIGILDPILPIGVLARCLLAYGGISEDYLVKSLRSQSQTLLTDVTDSGEEKPIIKKIFKDTFLEHNTFNSDGKRIFFSKDEAISPIILLQNANLPNDPIMSPLLADDELLRRLPPLSVFGCEFDPLLDDSVELCKKAEKAGAKHVRLQVMRNLPHGFLSMATPVTRECMAATKLCLEELKRLFQGDFH